MIAALFVEKNGCYFGLPGVDPWDKARDARKYAGPWPVVAHPPCERWGRYWFGGPTYAARHGERKKLGDDDGCFAAALEAVRTWGGVIEHPEGSHAWRWFGISCPPRSGGWISGGLFSEGWTCCVEQGWYGHRARKATWLYAVGIDLPTLQWGRAPGTFTKIDLGYHSTEERRRAIKTGICQRMSARQRAATPIEFRDLLLSMVSAEWARGCQASRLAAQSPRSPQPPSAAP